MAKTTSKAATAKENAQTKPEGDEQANVQVHSSDNESTNAQNENSDPANANANDQNNNPESNEQSTNSENNDAQNEPSGDEEPSVNVALLPVKLKGQRLTLAYPFDLQKGAHNLIIGSKSYVVEDIKFNPHTHRQEIELASATLLDESELDALIASGWYVQA